MAWRVSREPLVRVVIECGPSPQRRTTSLRRVSSPSAAKMGAATRGLRLAARLVKVGLDESDDEGPAVVVGGKGFGTAFERDLIEARFGDGDLDSVRELF